MTRTGLPPHGSVTECDVLIIGSGPAGMTIASALAGTARRVLLLESGGTVEQAVPRTVVKVMRPVTVESGDASASLLPDDALSFSYELSFPVIGDQYYAFAFSRAGFRVEIAPARTFGFLSELETLNKMNLAKGASLLNTLALDDSGVVNRRSGEPIRL